jgi:hypothetical protein
MNAKPPKSTQKPPDEKPMPKKKRFDSQAEQSRRFLETARRLGVDESGKKFDRAMNTVAPPTNRLLKNSIYDAR